MPVPAGTEVVVTVPTFAVPVHLAIIRSGRRRRCPGCHMKRVLLGAAATALTNPVGPSALSDFACAECWGIRRHGA